MGAGFKPAPTPHPHRKRLAEARKAREAIRKILVAETAENSWNDQGATLLRFCVSSGYMVFYNGRANLLRMENHDFETDRRDFNILPLHPSCLFEKAGIKTPSPGHERGGGDLGSGKH